MAIFANTNRNISEYLERTSLRARRKKNLKVGTPMHRTKRIEPNGSWVIECM